MASTVAKSLRQELTFWGVFLELSVYLKLKQLRTPIVGIEEERRESGKVCEDGQLAHEGRDKEAAMSVIDVLAVALEGREDLLPAEVERICPADAPVLQEENAGVVGVVEAFG